MPRSLTFGVLAAVCVMSGLGCCTGGPHCLDGSCGAGPGDGSAPCVACDGVGCAGGVAQHPLDHFRAGHCASGCGDIYIDEWLSDPPDCHDPCDHCGNWIGRGHPNWLPIGWKNWWGYRHQGHACGPDCGCGQWQGDESVYEGEMIYDGPVATQPQPATRTRSALQPTPAKNTSAVQPRTARPYYDRDFTNRQAVYR